MLNAQTEPAGRATQNEPLPTQETVKFWQLLQPYYGNDASVIIDVFNEPRPLTGTTAQQYMALWKNGGEYQGVDYLGHQQLAETLRAGGYAKNLLWVEPPGNYGLEYLTPAAAPAPAPMSPEAVRLQSALEKTESEATADPGTFLLTGVPDVGYSFHHRPFSARRERRRTGTPSSATSSGTTSCRSTTASGPRAQRTPASPPRTATAARAGATPPPPCLGTSPISRSSAWGYPAGR